MKSLYSYFLPVGSFVGLKSEFFNQEKNNSQASPSYKCGAENITLKPKTYNSILVSLQM
jgi:hypothetical protein